MYKQEYVFNNLNNYENLEFGLSQVIKIFGVIYDYCPSNIYKIVSFRRRLISSLRYVEDQKCRDLICHYIINLSTYKQMH